jgi:CBS domain containing-hemolysin-like protein
MPSEFYLDIVIFIVLLVCSAFFSGSEVALFSLQPGMVAGLSAERKHELRYVTALLARPRRLLITILVGNTLVNAAAALITAVMTVQLSMHFQWNATIALSLQVIGVTFVIIVLSELTPKVLAARTPMRIARRVALPLYIISILLTPFIAAFDTLIKKVELLAAYGKGKTALAADDIKTLVDVGSEEGEIDDEERNIIHSLINAKDTVVREVMTPRTEMAALEEDDATLDALIGIIVEKRHSRIPIYSDSIDNIRGIVFAKELLPFLHAGAENEKKIFSLGKYLRQPLFVPESKNIDALLKEFRKKKTHVAIAVDEYGGTAGIVTFQDIITGMVGDVGAEMGDSEVLVQQVSPTRFRFDASIGLDKAAELLDTDLHTEESFDTLGGLLLHLFGKIPRKGEQLKHRGITFTILRAAKNRINIVVAEKSPAAEKSNGAE